MTFFRFLIPVVLVLLIDLYFFQAVKTSTRDFTVSARSIIYWSYWLFTAFSISFILLLMLMPQTFLSKFTRIYTLTFIFIIVLSKLIGSVFLLMDDVARLFKWSFLKFGFFADSAYSGSRAKFMSQLGIIISFIPFSSMIYGMIKTAFDYKVRTVKLHLPNLPDAFNGYKIAQLSDIHSGSFSSGSPLKKAISLLLDQQPDLIFFTGDLVNNRSDEAENVFEELSEIKAKDGVYSVLGNHDYGDYVPWESKEAKAANLQQLVDIHARLGWKLLRNQNQILEKDGAQLAIIGVENWGAAMRFPKYGDLDTAKKGVEHLPVKLLLSHDPSHWDAKVRPEHPDIDVTFSGHTHGFQFGIEIPGFKWSPVQYVYKQWAGLYEEGTQKIYVNRGLGFLGYLGRVGILPEITVFELSNTSA
ncbi:MAG: 3',5'-cyclic adenosine monophosphate phosphodiesterase CpdA [Bacteroidia bacterium]|nr:3',5'-cyclic adenosine monophosphate phosphodiesterase CpdA [Bacteroidia bacterium]